MPIRTHDRYAYSAISTRPVYDWPGGKRLALYIALNLEWFSFDEGLGAELAPCGPQPDVLNYAWRDYGNRVALRHIVGDANERVLFTTAGAIAEFAGKLPPGSVP